MKKKWWIGVAIIIVAFLLIAEGKWIRERKASIRPEHTNAVGNYAGGGYDGAAYGSGVGTSTGEMSLGSNGDGSGIITIDLGLGSAADFAQETVQSKIQELLYYSSRDFIAGYAVDETFFQWFLQNYGEESFEDIRSYVTGNEKSRQEPEYWYQTTGNSIHVLWLGYCRDRQYATYQLPNVTWKDCANREEIVVDIIGDINFDEDWYTMEAYEERQENFNLCISEAVQQELQSADIMLLNNEFTYSDRGTAIEGKAYTFRALPQRVELLTQLGTDIVSLANNHTYDYGEEALCDTVDTLNQENIAYVGAGHNLNEAKKIEYVVANGRKIAFVAATQIEKYNTYTKEATDSSAGVLKTLQPDKFLSVIREAKEHSDYVIAYVHWGVEGTLYVEEDQRALAEAYIHAGADAVVGNHSHRLQGIEYIQGVPVFHSLGNFWFSTGTLYTAIAQLRIQEDGTIRVCYIPCLQKDMMVTRISGKEEIEEFYRYLADISENVGIAEDGTVYNLEEVTDSESRLLQYRSGQKYDTRTGAYDLENRRINIVGNLVND